MSNEGLIPTNKGESILNIKKLKTDKDLLNAEIAKLKGIIVERDKKIQELRLVMRTAVNELRETIDDEWSFINEHIHVFRATIKRLREEKI